MQLPKLKGLPHALLALTSLLSLASAHTWIEAINHIAPNGTLTEPTGYPRGYIPRGGPGFTGNENTAFTKFNGPNHDAMAGTQVCNPLQNSPQQSPGSPRLQAAPGDLIALRYTENGHITGQTRQGRTPGQGNVAIYGTTKDRNPRFGALLQMTPNGTLEQGRVVANQSFDDGRCYESPATSVGSERAAKAPMSGQEPLPKVGGNELPCQNDIAIPHDAPVGQPLTLYWVWNYTYVDYTGKPLEIYANCIDIDVVALDGAKATSHANVKAATPVVKYAASQPAVSAAAAVYFNHLANGGDGLIRAVGATDNAANAMTPNNLPNPAAPAATNQPSKPSGQPAIPFMASGPPGAPLSESTAAPTMPAPSALASAAPVPSAPPAGNPHMVAKGPVSIIVANPASPVLPMPAPPAPTTFVATSAPTVAPSVPPAAPQMTTVVTTVTSAVTSVTIPATAIVMPSHGPVIGTFVAFPEASGTGYSVSIVGQGPSATAPASGVVSAPTVAAGGVATPVENPAKGEALPTAKPEAGEGHPNQASAALPSTSAQPATPAAPASVSQVLSFVTQATATPVSTPTADATVSSGTAPAAPASTGSSGACTPKGVQKRSKVFEEHLENHKLRRSVKFRFDSLTHKLPPKPHSPPDSTVLVD